MALVPFDVTPPLAVAFNESTHPLPLFPGSATARALIVTAGVELYIDDSNRFCCVVMMTSTEFWFDV
jgi:hypothetical protein